MKINHKLVLSLTHTRKSNLHLFTTAVSIISISMSSDDWVGGKRKTERVSRKAYYSSRIYYLNCYSEQVTHTHNRRLRYYFYIKCYCVLWFIKHRFFFSAIAASAPIFQFRHTTVDEGVYDSIVTRSFVNAGCNIDTVSNAFIAMKKLGITSIYFFK